MEALFDTRLADEPDHSDRVVIQPLYGGSLRPVYQMSHTELKTVAEAIMVTVREAAFSRGLPIIVERNGQTIRQYADGHAEPVN